MSIPRATAALGLTVVATVAALPSAFGSGPAVQHVTTADIGPGNAWLRLQDDPNNAARAHGVQEVTSLADPSHFDGSAHLAVGGGEQSQLAHYFSAAVPFADLAKLPIGYDSRLVSATSTATGVAASLQLPAICQGAFTTLSFQPQLATDDEGRHGVVPDVWQSFTNSGASLWRTSRAIGALAAGSDHSFDTYVQTCSLPADGAFGVIANVGRLGDDTATLDTYVDNLAVNGTSYNFAVAGAASGSVDTGGTPPETQPGGAPITKTFTFTSPANGPLLEDVATRLVISGVPALRPQDLTVTADGSTVTLVQEGSTLVGTVAAHTRSLPSLLPGGTVTSTFAIGTTAEAPVGTITVTGELLAAGLNGPTPTGITATSTLDVAAPPVKPGITPEPKPKPQVKPGPVLPVTGTSSIAPLTLAGSATAAAAVLLLVSRRRWRNS